MQIGGTDYYAKELIVALMDIHMFNLKRQKPEKKIQYLCF